MLVADWKESLRRWKIDFSHFHFQLFPQEKFVNQQKLSGLFRSKSGAEKHIIAIESWVPRVACRCLSSELRKQLALWLKCRKNISMTDWVYEKKKSDLRTLEGFNELSWTIVWRSFYWFSQKTEFREIKLAERVQISNSVKEILRQNVSNVEHSKEENRCGWIEVYERVSQIKNSLESWIFKKKGFTRQICFLKLRRSRRLVYSSCKIDRAWSL